MGLVAPAESARSHGGESTEALRSGVTQFVHLTRPQQQSEQPRTD